MAFLVINGITVPVLAGSAKVSPKVIGGQERAFDATLLTTRSRVKEMFAATRQHTGAAEAEAFHKLLLGEGHTWSFASHVYSSLGLGPSSGAASITTANGVARTCVSSVTGETWTLNANAEVIDGAEKYLSLLGGTGDYVTTPDAAVLDITGDLEITMKVAPNDWTPSNTPGMLDKGGSGVAGYRFLLVSSGVLRLNWYDGATTFTVNSTVATGFTDGVARWVRVTLDVSNGSGVYEVKFYTSTDGSSWTQLGATVTGAAATSIAAGTRPLQLGTRDNATAGFFAGKIYFAEVRNGIGGTVVASFDADDFALNGTTLARVSGDVLYPVEASGPWTVFGWYRPVSTNTLTHYVLRSDGAKWVGGTRSDSTSTTFMDISGTDLRLRQVSSLNSYFDDLVFLPYEVPDDWPALIFAEQTSGAWSALPFLNARGDMIRGGAETLVVRGKDVSSRSVRATPLRQVLDFQLEEV